MKKIVLMLSFIAVFNPISFAQTTPKTTPGSSTQPSSYAYVRIKGKAFSKKLKVEVDFGDSQEQLDKGEKFSEILTNKKSYAAVLNYMAENGFELVQTFELTSSYQGSGGTSGIVFIMKKKEAD